MELPPLEPDHLRELEIERLTLDAWACRFDNRARCRDLSLEALLLADELRYRLGQGLALKNLGYCEYLDSEYERALEKFGEALTIAREEGDLHLERDCLNFCGATYHRLGDLDTAIDLASQTLKINQSLQDEPAVISSLNNFGVLHAEIGQHTEAVRLLADALERTRKIGEPIREVTVLANLGKSLNALGRTSESVDALRRALRLADDHQLIEIEGPCLVNLAEALTKLARFDEALEVLDQALELVRETGAPDGEVHCLLGSSRIHLERGRFALALEPGERALEAAAVIKHRALELEAHQVIAEAQKGLGHFERALWHFERFHTIERETRELASEGRLRAVNAQFEVRRARHEAEIERLRNVELAQALSRLEEANREKTELLRQLEAKSHELELQVLQDPLTKLYNRRHLEAALRSEYQKAQAKARPLPVAILDVDGFKGINDTFSHQVGDAVLIRIAEILHSSLRAFDLAARYGGEEFVVALPRTSPEQARIVCERLRHAVASFDWSIIHPQLAVTLSIGLASDTTLEHSEKLLAAADAKLYEAKRSGKNCVRG